MAWVGTGKAQGRFVNDRVGIEFSGGIYFQGGREDVRLLGENLDRFGGTKVDEVEKLVDGGGSMQHN